MKVEFKKVLDEIRTESLDTTGNRYNFEIDLNDHRIAASTKLSLETEDFSQLADKLPPSFITFVKNCADGLFIDIGNALTIFPVAGNVDGFSANVSSETKNWLDEFPSNEFIVFGKLGVDYEFFCFYTGKKLKNGEYPVVWFSPGLVCNRRFMLLNTGFDKFLTIQYYLLRATDLHENDESLAEIMNDSSYLKNPLYREAEERESRNWQNFLNHLYSNFDSEMPKPNHEYYKSAVSFEELIRQIDQVQDNIR